MRMYDVIGDIHGEYQKLCNLLQKMGYVHDEKRHIYVHPKGRQALFIGDLLDRGLENLKVIDLVRRMVEANVAHCIMGNHEYNAVQIVSPHPDKKGEFVRPQTEKFLLQQQTFFDELDFESGMPSARHSDIVNWFKTLPVYLEIDNLVAVHACWYPSAVKRLQAQGYLDVQGRITDSGWLIETDRTTQDFDDLNALLKGPDGELPALNSINEYGHKRDRLAWWNLNPRTIGESFACLSDQYNEVASAPFSPSMQTPLIKNIQADLRGFKGLAVFGHISLMRAPGFLSPHVVCVDYNAGRGGELIAYRVDNTNNPHQGHFFSEVRGRLKTITPTRDLLPA